MSFGGLGEDTVDLQPATVVASADDADPLGAALLGAVDSSRSWTSPSGGSRPRTSAGETQASGAALGIIIPEGFSDAVLSGQAASVQLVEGDGAGAGNRRR